MRLMMRSILFGMLAVAICGAQHLSNHGGALGGFHGGASGVRATGSGVRFANPGFGRLNSLPPPASGISIDAWREMQRSNRFAYGQVPYGYFSAPYYYPFLGYSDTGYASSSYDPPPAQDSSLENMMAAQGTLSHQVQILSDQIEQLRNAQQRGAVPGNEDPQQATPQTAITVVLRNGQQIQVQNYAVMNQTMWDFTRQPARKIPVSSIDIAASTSATEAKGAEFPQLNGTQ